MSLLMKIEKKNCLVLFFEIGKQVCEMDGDVGDILNFHGGGIEIIVRLWLSKPVSKDRY